MNLFISLLYLYKIRVEGGGLRYEKILLLLADGFEAVEASVFTDVLGWNKWEGDGSTEVVTVGLRNKLTCTWNFTVIPEKRLMIFN